MRREAVPITDQWTSTNERCDWASYRESYSEDLIGPNESNWGASGAPPLYPSEQCVDAVLADLAVDTSALLRADGLQDPYGLVHGNAGQATRIGNLLMAARITFLYEYGQISELATSELVSDVYVARMQRAALESGVESLGAAHYNFMTSHIDGVVLPERESSNLNAQFDAGTRTVYLHEWFGVTTPTDALGTLLHEAEHYYAPRHVACDGGAWAECDEDVRGSYGTTIAFGLAIAEHYPDEWIDPMYIVWDGIRQVNAFRDDETGYIDAAWYDIEPGDY